MKVPLKDTLFLPLSRQARGGLRSFFFCKTDSVPSFFFFFFFFFCHGTLHISYPTQGASQPLRSQGSHPKCRRAHPLALDSPCSVRRTDVRVLSHSPLAERTRPMIYHSIIFFVCGSMLETAKLGIGTENWGVEANLGEGVPRFRGVGSGTSRITRGGGRGGYVSYRVIAAASNTPSRQGNGRRS